MQGQKKTKRSLISKTIASSREGVKKWGGGDRRSTAFPTPTPDASFQPLLWTAYWNAPLIASTYSAMEVGSLPVMSLKSSTPYPYAPASMARNSSSRPPTCTNTDGRHARWNSEMSKRGGGAATL